MSNNDNRCNDDYSEIPNSIGPDDVATDEDTFDSIARLEAIFYALRKWKLRHP